MLRNVSSLFNIFADWSVASKFRNINIHEEIRPPPLKCTCTCLLREHNVGFQCIASYSTCTLHALMYRRVCYACTVVHYMWRLVLAISNVNSSLENREVFRDVSTTFPIFIAVEHSLTVQCFSWIFQQQFGLKKGSEKSSFSLSVTPLSSILLGAANTQRLVVCCWDRELPPNTVCCAPDRGFDHPVAEARWRLPGWPQFEWYGGGVSSVLWASLVGVPLLKPSSNLNMFDVLKYVRV